jgi:hypothetical protein
VASALCRVKDLHKSRGSSYGPRRRLQVWKLSLSRPLSRVTSGDLLVRIRLCKGNVLLGGPRATPAASSRSPPPLRAGDRRPGPGPSDTLPGTATASGPSLRGPVPRRAGSESCGTGIAGATTIGLGWLRKDRCRDDCRHAAASCAMPVPSSASSTLGASVAALHHGTGVCERSDGSTALLTSSHPSPIAAEETGEESGGPACIYGAGCWRIDDRQDSQEWQHCHWQDY